MHNKIGNVLFLLCIHTHTFYGFSIIIRHLSTYGPNTWHLADTRPILWWLKNSDQCSDVIFESVSVPCGINKASPIYQDPFPVQFQPVATSMSLAITSFYLIDSSRTLPDATQPDHSHLLMMAEKTLNFSSISHHAEQRTPTTWSTPTLSSLRKWKEGHRLCVASRGRLSASPAPRV